MATNPLVSSLGSYFTPMDGYRHAIVAMPDGEVYEIFFRPQTGVGRARLACFCGLRFVTAFYTPDDGFQHPIIGTETGDVFEVFYKPGDFHVTQPLVSFPSMIALSAFFAADDKMRILIVGTADGAIHEIFYNPGIGVHVTQPQLATFPGLTHLAAFYTADDKYRHVIAATSNGDVTEVFYHPTIGVHITQPPLATFQDIVSLAAFYAEDDNMRIVHVATGDGAIHEVFYSPSVGVHVTQPALATFPDIAGVSSFYTPDDKYRHVIAADASGGVTEVFYHPSIGVHVSQPPLAQFDIPLPRAEYVGPDLATLDAVAKAGVDASSPAGRCLALAGDASRLYTLSHSGGVWSSPGGGPWTLQRGSPAPAELDASVYLLAVSPNDTGHGLAAAGAGLWETTDAGLSWIKVLDPADLGAPSSLVNAVAFDTADRVFAAVTGGVAVRVSASAPFQLMPLGDTITAVAVSENKVWARSATALFVSATHGASWSSRIPLPTTVTFMFKERFALAATDDFAYLIATRPGAYNPQTHPYGCAGDNVLVIFNAATGQWTDQDVTSTDLLAWEQSHGKGLDPHTCNGTGGDDAANGRRLIKCIQLSDTSLADVVGERVQLLYGAGQEVWRARGQGPDGTITDWNWVIGTTGGGFTDHDPVHGDIWDVHLDPAAGGRTAWLAGDGGVFAATVKAANYEFTNATWQPVMAGLHTHQIQSLTLLRTDQVHRPRLAYVLGDNSAFFRDTTAIPMPEAPWQSYPYLGDGNMSAGDSSAPLFAFMARQLDTSVLLRFGAGPQGARLINPKQGPFIDPATPIRFRFLPAPPRDGQFPTADVVMMVDLPLTFSSNNADVPFPVQPGPPSNGAPVLIRNGTFDANPDINAANAQGKGWTLERATLPAGAQGFAVTGDHAQPVYYVFDGGTLYAERNGNWTPVMSNLASTQLFGPVFPNPYNSHFLYVLTRDKGVQVSNNAGSTFQPDASLNALVGANPSDINQIAFNYDRPQCVVAGTESGKLLFSPGGGVWHDLTNLLPSPPIPIRSVAIDCEAIYLATFGRGLQRVAHYADLGLRPHVTTDAEPGAASSGTTFRRG